MIKTVGSLKEYQKVVAVGPMVEDTSRRPSMY